MDEKTVDSIDQLATMTRSAVAEESDDDIQRPSVPGLTIMAHPNLPRIGERSPIRPWVRGTEIEISSRTPLFAPPGKNQFRPLADPHLPARALLLRATADGGIEIRSASPEAVTVDRGPLADTRRLSPAHIERGVSVLLYDRVLLRLHLIDKERLEPTDDLIGESRSIYRLRRQIQRAASLDVPILLRGEPGSGKTQTAHCLHRTSNRGDAQMVAVDMAGVHPDRAIIDFFGSSGETVAKGSQGYFARANGGTLFLDNVEATPECVQGLLLRALETHSIRRPNGTGEQAIDLRILSATGSATAIDSGRLRPALLHRLSGFEIAVPALRQRRADIPRLLLHFLTQALATREGVERFAPSQDPQLPASLMQRFLEHDWPGNVGELRHAVLQLIEGSDDTCCLHLTPELDSQLAQRDSPSRAPRRRSASSVRRSLGESVLDSQTLAAIRWCCPPTGQTGSTDYHHRARRDQALREVLLEYGGQKVEHKDGLLLLFPRPLDALGFALETHDQLEHVGWQCGAQFNAGMALVTGEILSHAGDPSVERGGELASAMTDEIARVTARELACLATEGQTLLNQGAFDQSRQALTPGHPLSTETVNWSHHGLHRVAGRRIQVFGVVLT